MMTSKRWASSSKTSLDMHAVGPAIDVTLGGQIALAPAHTLVRLGLFESSDGRSRKFAGILAEQGDQCFLEVAAGDAF